MTPEETKQCWSRYYEFASSRLPRELLIQAMRRFGERGQYDGMAVDFGCGPGIETMTLLHHGWHVLAVDYHPEAIERVKVSVPDEVKPRLQTRQASFEQVDLPSSDLIWAGYSLPFCPPQHLLQVMGNIAKALKPGGRFAGDFFAPRHAWADEDHATALPADQIKEAFSSLHLEYWIEHEGERDTAIGIQHWHAYGVIYRKPE